MQDKIYIIGHKSPDLDSVMAAIAYAEYKNKMADDTSYKAAVAGNMNKESLYILDRFGIEAPVLLEDAKDKKLVLVDHNEASQSVDGAEPANVLEILDHHKIDFKSSDPITITIKPWGSSCSMIADMFFESGMDIDKALAGGMLAAVLVDTVLTKSPTCTEQDKEIIEKLSGIAGISDWQAFGMEVFKVRSDISDLSNMEIIKSDFKDFEFKQGKFGIGQVETADLSLFESREGELIEEMKNLLTEGSYHSVVLFLTDIINIGSKFLVVSNDYEKIESALGKKLEDNKVYLEGVISRKKQVAPMMLEVFDK